MSRELFVRLDESEVMSRCLAENVGVSAIERLPAGGIRLVCMSGHGAALMTRKFKASLIKEPVVRQRHRPTRPLW
jgi:hypothetical protein